MARQVTAAAAFESSTPRTLEAGAVNRDVLYAAAQLDAHKTMESSGYEQQGVAQTVNTVSSSLVTVASSTRGVSALATGLPKVQSNVGLSAADSALLWMAEQWDADKATEVGIGGLAHKHRSNLTPNVTTSVFSGADDWMVEVATNKGQ
jgi:hypothetical protein